MTTKVRILDRVHALATHKVAAAVTTLGIIAMAAFVAVTASGPALGDAPARPQPTPALLPGVPPANPTRSDGPIAPEPLAQAQALSNAFSQAAAAVQASVVEITVESRARGRGPRGRGADPFGWMFPPPGMPPMPGMPPSEPLRRGTGSGVIVRADGFILTNNHVVEQASRIKVRTQDRRTFVANVVGSDPGSDLAVLRVNATNLPAARLGDSDAIRVGEWVVAVGSPFGLDYTVTAGVLSAKGRGGIGMNPIEDYLQTDASINPGNSGGPLCNLRGEVVGINSMIVGMNSGIGFAIPVNLARRVADQIIATGRVRRAWIGVGIQELTPDLAPAFGATGQQGALVNSVVPNGPAARAGLLTGDVIMSLDGTPVGDGQQLVRVVMQRDVGRPVRLRILRGGQARDLVVTTGDRPEEGRVQSAPAPGPARPSAQFGLRLGPSPDGAVRVEAVEPGSAAEQAGLRPGDSIVQVGPTPVSQPSTVAQILQRDGGGVLLLRREEGSFFVALRP